MKPNREDPLRTAVFTGTFDPITLGHLDVIGSGRLLVRAPGGGHRRQSQQGRRSSTSTSGSRWRGTVVRPFPNVSVEPFEGLTVNYVRRIGAPGDPARPAHALRHGVRVRHDAHQPSTRSRGRDGLS